MVAIRTCGFHDHDDPPPLGARWTGRITDPLTLPMIRGPRSRSDVRCPMSQRADGTY